MVLVQIPHPSLFHPASPERRRNALLKCFNAHDCIAIRPRPLSASTAGARTPAARWLTVQRCAEHDVPDRKHLSQGAVVQAGAAGIHAHVLQAMEPETELCFSQPSSEAEVSIGVRQVLHQSAEQHHLCERQRIDAHRQSHRCKDHLLQPDCCCEGIVKLKVTACRKASMLIVSLQQSSPPPWQQNDGF